MDYPEDVENIQVDEVPLRKSRSGSQRKRKSNRGLTGESPSPSPPAALPLTGIPTPPPAHPQMPPPPSDGDNRGASSASAGGRSRAWMLANLRRGGDVNVVTATTPDTASDSRASTQAAPPMRDDAYPVEDTDQTPPTTGKKMKKVKKVKKDSSKSAETPSTAQHYVDYDSPRTPGDAKVPYMATASMVEVANEGEESVFDDPVKTPPPATNRTTTTTHRHHNAGYDSDDSQPRKGEDDPRRDSLTVGVTVDDLADNNNKTRPGSRRGREGEREAVEVEARPAQPGTKTSLAPAGTLDFYSLPRLMRLQQTFESHRSQLYNYCATHVLEWPTMAVEWIPDRRFADPERDYTLQYVAVGTQAARGSRNSVRVMEVAVPVYFNTGAMYNLFGDDDINGATGATAEEFEAVVDPGKLFKNIRGHFHTDQVVSVDSPVLKIKAMPIESNTIAVKTASGLIKVYNLVRDLTEDASGLTTPEAILVGHKIGGFGLSWSAAKPGFIASGGDDGYVNYWDISHRLTVGLDADEVMQQQMNHSPDMAGIEVQPMQRLTGHRDIVTDVSCHHSQGHLIASSSMDGDVRIWDTRSGASSNMTIPEAHEGGATAAQFHPLGDFQIATGGRDGAVGLWDIRHSRREVTSLSYHGKSVTGIQWSPFKETLFSSFGEDGRVVFWDLSKTTLPMSYSEDGMAPPEVAFVHVGHLGRVTDFSWSSGKDDNWLVASADTMNGVHFYQPRIDVVEDYRVDKQFAALRR